MAVPSTLEIARLALVAALSAGCGARSTLEAYAGRPVTSDCPAALLAGAPAPMGGYCSTRARVTPGSLPAAPPQIAWKLPQPPKLLFTAGELVVDDQGRAYAAIDTNPLDVLGTPDTIVAFDPDGSVVWSSRFEGPQGLFLAADGKLRFRVATGPPMLAVVARDGAIEGMTPLPAAQALDFAVGRDGSLFTQLLTPDPFTGVFDASIAKLTPDGAFVWASELFPLCGSLPPITLTDDDRVVIAFQASTGELCQAENVLLVVGLDGAGTMAWEHVFPGILAVDAGVAPDGTIRVGYAADYTTGPMHLVSFDASGALLWDTELVGTASNVYGSASAITSDGTAIVRTNAGLVAVSKEGARVWQRAESPAFAYDVVADRSGALVVNDFETVGLDAATGHEAWSLDGAAAPIQAPIAAGPAGSLVGTLDVDGQFSLFLARDP
jgi:outer membrane protein assembly factor BamB